MVSSSQDLFAGAFGKGVFRSTNNGTHWFAANTGFDAKTVYAYLAVPDGTGGTKLFAGTALGVYSSTDNGLEWNYEGLDLWVTGLALVGNEYFCRHNGIRSIPFNRWRWNINRERTGKFNASDAL